MTKRRKFVGPCCTWQNTIDGKDIGTSPHFAASRASSPYVKGHLAVAAALPVGVHGLQLLGGGAGGRLRGASESQLGHAFQAAGVVFGNFHVFLTF